MDVGEVYASIWRCNTKEEDVDSWKEDEVDGNKEIKEVDDDWHQEGCASQEIKEDVMDDTIEIKEEEADSCEEDGQHSDWSLRSIQHEELNDQYIADQQMLDPLRVLLPTTTTFATPPPWRQSDARSSTPPWRQSHSSHQPWRPPRVPKFISSDTCNHPDDIPCFRENTIVPRGSVAWGLGQKAILVVWYHN